MKTVNLANSVGTFDDFKNDILNDYYICYLSRQISILGRKEVLSGRGKFGIFGDGKELPQVAMAKVFKKGDFRSGYYRDMTFAIAIGLVNTENLFSYVYGNPDPVHEPMSSGRQMIGHYNSDVLDEVGNLIPFTENKNSFSDVSSTASQMPRLLGLAYASKFFKKHPDAIDKRLSNDGNEIAWGTIGNASTSEGLFFETINAAGVMQVPMVTSVWDDDYGISVNNSFQTVKESISEALKGMQRNNEEDGIEIFVVNGWDYPALVETYTKASRIAREEHVPVLIHVTELTQPLGHSTSGSHERYKSNERLDWEKKQDCNLKFREWIIDKNIATKEQIQDIEKKASDDAKKGRDLAWSNYLKPIEKQKKEAYNLINKIYEENPNVEFLSSNLRALSKNLIYRKSIYEEVRKVLYKTTNLKKDSVKNLKNWWSRIKNSTQKLYSDKLYNEFESSSLNLDEIKPEYELNENKVDGRVVLKENFKVLLDKNKKLLIFGEDTGKIGDVNQGLEGLQEIFGEERVSDRGIREATIIGEGIGMAFRGLRPIAEIQYLDYLLYGIQLLSDDLATLHYRTRGKQIAPLIIRTRGHRLEGIWHSGSPMGGILGLLRGIFVLVPRNLTQAAGMYNTLLKGFDPALLIEPLNGYRKKEKLPKNLGEFTVPIGLCEKLIDGNDITVVSYGSTVNIVVEAADILKDSGIKIEVIDVQTLIPFDRKKLISASLNKTNRLMIVDEDVPGGGSGYILSELIKNQEIYSLLDCNPVLLTAKEHRPAYGTDGDYFSKPSKEDIYEEAYKIMHESNPKKYPEI